MLNMGLSADKVSRSELLRNILQNDDNVIVEKLIQYKDKYANEITRKIIELTIC
jgi:hypothetical protein